MGVDRGHDGAGLITDGCSDGGDAFFVFVDDPAPTQGGDGVQALADLGVFNNTLGGEAFERSVEVSVDGIRPGMGEHRKAR